MTMEMLCLGDFDPRSREADAGRIPSCIEWLNLGFVARQELLSLFASDITFDTNAIARLGWIGIDAETDGQPEDDDEALLATMLAEWGITQLLASSRWDIERAYVGGQFLGARVFHPTGRDLCDLRSGFWASSNWGDVLMPLCLMWGNWREQFLFTWPLQFALVQLCEGEGHTTLVGSPDFINEFKDRSNPAHWYKWQPWGVLPKER